MLDIEKTANEIKKCLKKNGFSQKGTAPVFFYDRKWYFIFAELINTDDNIYVINGIQYFWHYDDLAAIREETKDDLNYCIKEYSPRVITDVCKWINTKKEYYLKKYENPAKMLTYLAKYDDMSHQPHGYVLARILKKKPEKDYFEKSTKDRLNEINVNSNIYFPYGSKEKFREVEAQLNGLMKMTDENFVVEITRLINQNRENLRLTTYEKYFD